MSTLADNEDELVLEDQTISPGSPKVTKDSDEVVQLLVTVEIENGENHSDLEKTTEIEAAPEVETAEALIEADAVEEAVQNGEEKTEQPCQEVEEVQEPPAEPPEETEQIHSGEFLLKFHLAFDYFKPITYLDIN